MTPAERRKAIGRYAAGPPGLPEALRRRPCEHHVYLNFAGSAEGTNKAIIQAYIFPLVSWIWIGFWVLMIGTIICLVPSKQRLAFARTQVVGVTSKKYAEVEK